MNEYIEQVYAKEGKDIAILIQEWINENIENTTCKIKTTELECNRNR